MANRFSVIRTQIMKKPYDFLDQRKQEFAQDYEDFLRQIKELHVSHSVLLTSHFHEQSMKCIFCMCDYSVYPKQPRRLISIYDCHA